MISTAPPTRVELVTFGLGMPTSKGGFAQSAGKRLARETRLPEVARDNANDVQSMANSGIAELESAIANVTRMLGRTDSPDVAADLVRERGALRSALAALQRPPNVVPLRKPRP